MDPEGHKSKWNLTQLELLEKTPRGTLFKCESPFGSSVLKVYTGEGIKEERQGGRFLLACGGAPAVEVFKHDDRAILLEFCDGPKLSSLVEQGKDLEAAEIAAELLHRLHQISVPERHGFISLEERLSPLQRAATNRDFQDHVLFKRAFELSRNLLKDKENTCLLHGDVHHDNIIHHSRKGWVLIDPKGFVGDPAYDFANFFSNPWDMPDVVRRRDRALALSDCLSQSSAIPQEKLLQYAFVHSCVSQVWFLEDYGESSPHAQAMMRILSELV